MSGRGGARRTTRRNKNPNSNPPRGKKDAIEKKAAADFDLGDNALLDDDDDIVHVDTDGVTVSARTEHAKKSKGATSRMAKDPKARQSESESEQADQTPKANPNANKGSSKAARNGKNKKAADCDSEQLVNIINNLSSDALIPLKITAPMLLDLAPTGDRKPFELKSVMYDPEQLLRWKTRVATKGLVNMYKTVEQCRIDLTTMMFIIQTAYDGKVLLGGENGSTVKEYDMLMKMLHVAVIDHFAHGEIPNMLKDEAEMATALGEVHLLLEDPRGRVYADQASCDELSLGYSAPLYPVSRLSVLSLWVGAVLARTSLAP